MNKAFVREPDDNGQLQCPQCGSLGTPVTAETWRAQLAHDTTSSVAETAFFCTYAKCDVVYFDMFDRVIRTGELRCPVYPKDPQAPVCACFGLTTDDIDGDIAEGVVTRVREVIAKAKSPEARCRTAAPSGQSCVAEVQRYYMKRRNG